MTTFAEDVAHGAAFRRARDQDHLLCRADHRAGFSLALSGLLSPYGKYASDVPEFVMRECFLRLQVPDPVYAEAVSYARVERKERGGAGLD